MNFWHNSMITQNIVALKFVRDFRFHRLDGDVTPSKSEACDGKEAVSRMIANDL